MTILTFQDAAERSLSLIRFETNPEEDDDEDSVDEDEESDEDEDEEDEAEQPKQRNLRRSSTTLVNLIKEHTGIDLGKRVDKQYLLEAIFKNQAVYAKLEKKEFEKRMIQLQRIIGVMHKNAGTSIKFFTEITGVFYKFYIQKSKKHNLEDAYPEMVHKYIHADKDISTAHVIEKQRRRMVKLSNQFEEDWDDVKQKLLTAFHAAMDYGDDALFLDPKEKNQITVGLAASLAGSFGTRKADLVDPNIKYYTWKRWNTLRKQQGLALQPFRIGAIVLDNAKETRKTSIAIDEELWSAQESTRIGDELNMEYVGVQIGSSKDKRQRQNKYLPTKDDDRYVPDLVIIRPNVILTMDQFIKGRKLLLKLLGITEANFKPSEHESARAVGSRKFGGGIIKPVLKKMFPGSFALTLHYGYRSGFGLHFLRKIYVAAAVELYTQQIKNVTGEFKQANVITSILLSHQGGIETSLSYQNVRLTFRPQAEAFGMPPEHLVRKLMSEIDVLRTDLSDLKKQIARDKLEAAEVHVSKGPEVMFTLADGSNVFVKRYVRNEFIAKQYGSQAECDNARFEYLQIAYDRMQVAGVPTTEKNMTKLGMGKSTFTFRKKVLESGRPPVVVNAVRPPRAAVAAVPIAPVIIPSKKRKNTIQLKENVKIVKKRAKTAVKTAQIYKEDIERFGEEKIIPSASVCTGRVVEDIKFTPQLKRDVCIDGKAEVGEFPLHPKAADLTVQ